MTLLTAEQCENMFRGYRQIFWGIILMLFHVNLGPVQLLPDFVGYILFYLGISSLRKYSDSKKLSRATVIAGILLAESIIEFIIPFFGDKIIIPLPFTALIMGITSILVLLLFYNILTASSDILRQINDASLADETDRRLRIFLIINMFVCIASVLLVLWPTTILFWVTIICGIILRLWFASVFDELKRKFDTTINQNSSVE